VYDRSGEEIGCYAKGHHPPAAFAEAFAAWMRDEERGGAYMGLDPGAFLPLREDEVKHATWREDEGDGADLAWVFVAAKEGEPGAYPVTCYAFDGGELAASSPSSAPPATPARPDPTHRCKVCGALWIKLPPNPLGGWSLWSRSCGPCCDNVEMGEQIEPLDGFHRLCDPGPWGEPSPAPSSAPPAETTAWTCPNPRCGRVHTAPPDPCCPCGWPTPIPAPPAEIERDRAREDARLRGVERDAMRARVQRLSDALEEIASGRGCRSGYGGCDGACKEIAHKALKETP
jgi:hypothetical protein